MRCLLVSEVPIDHRSGWYRHVATTSDIDLHVLYLRSTPSSHRWDQPGDRQWTHSLEPSGRLGATARSSGLRSVLAEVDPDVVVLTGWSHQGSLLAARWCREKSVPFALMFDLPRSGQDLSKYSSVSRRARVAVLEKAVLALPVGARAERLAVALGMQRSQTLYANTCDSVSIAADTALAARGDDLTVLYVGWLTEADGAGLLPSIADALADLGMKLQVIGDGPLRSAIDRSPAELLGPKPGPEIFQSMAAAQVVVVPSLVSTPGVVVHEALSCGTPVAATHDVDMAATLLTGFDGGSVVDPTVDEIVVGCRNLALFANARNARAMCQEQAQTVSYETVSEALRDALEEVVGSAKISS